MRNADTRKVQQRRSFCFLFFLSLSCLQFSISLRFWHGTTQQGLEKHQRGSEFEISLRQHQSKLSGLRLRWDWTRLERHSELADRMVEHQKNCTRPLANFHYRNRFGLGSDLHVYSVAMCNALEAGSFRVRTSLPWIWLDHSTADCNSNAESAMACYFPSAELQCPDDQESVKNFQNHFSNMTRGRGRIKEECPQLRATYGVPAIRAATTEFLFTRISASVQREALRQLSAVFAHHKTVPRNLITVHIRWGDKADEMKLLPISDYIKGVEQILLQPSRAAEAQNNDQVNIFLATEDPKALKEFRAAAPTTWNIYVDQYFYEMLPYRQEQYNGSPMMSQELNGRPGTVALGSLLVAMEANDFVLTTASNWSRLINELRRNVLDHRCGHCTHMIDLSPGEW